MQSNKMESSTEKYYRAKKLNKIIYVLIMIVLICFTTALALYSHSMVN